MTESTLPRGRAGDLWGGLAAMLVALPSAIAFGVTVFAPLGSAYGARGAVAGILGATALGLIAPALGGTNRLISAPCAPAAAVLAATAMGFAAQGVPGETAVLLLVLVGLLCGLLQVGLGLLGVGRLIKYIPYPVVSGYLSGVGLTIIAGQLPRLLGTPKEMGFWKALASPAAWQWQGLLVGAVVIAAMLLAGRFTKLVPAAIVALLSGVASYLALGFADPALWVLEGNRFLVGPLGGGEGSLLDAMTRQWQGLAGLMNLALLAQAVAPALTLAVLLSIDTLKTCVVLDSMTRSHHDSNRELVAQGLGNLGASLLGGIPGAGTMGATLINLASGAQTRLSGVMEGVFSLLAFLLLAGVVAWVPIAALAAILLVIGYRMIDRQVFNLARSPATRFDLAVIVAVVVTALTVNLIAASGIGIVLAALLFLREQTKSSVVRRKVLGNEIFSRQARLARDMEMLERNGEQTVVVELQGSLFFGTANQLYQALEPEIGLRRYVILNLRRVQSLDLTATHVLEQIKEAIEEKGGTLVFCDIPRGLPSGIKMKKYLKEVGLVRDTSTAVAFRLLDEALEWVEGRILQEDLAEQAARSQESTLALAEFELFRGRRPETLAALEAIMESRRVVGGERIFHAGDPGDQLILIRRGAVRVQLAIHKKDAVHLGTFGRGDFIGEMGFLDGGQRSADAVALAETELYILSREPFNALAEQHRVAALQVYEGVARVLSMRLRYANAELRALRE